MNFWQGQKVRLRGVEPTDAETFFRWNLDSEMSRRLEYIWPPVSAERVRDFVRQQSLKTLEGDAFTWVIEAAHGQTAVGTIATHHCEPQHGTFMYGIHVAREHARKGYAAEAIRLVLKYYFEERRYQKATVSVHAYNEASRALHEKLGFRHEGTLRRMIYTRGEYFDQLWYGMTREEWAESPLKL
ncbi:MAG TPA: GNAT family protein [Pyrinomonadaceae bacterium]|nr:GNAT family protein [Pyrinomonadaceae bacterium]